MPQSSGFPGHIAINQIITISPGHNPINHIILHPSEHPSIKCPHPPHHHAGRTGRDLSLRIAFTRVNTHHPNASARENHQSPIKKNPEAQASGFFFIECIWPMAKCIILLVVHSTHTTWHSAWHWCWIVFFFFS